MFSIIVPYFKGKPSSIKTPYMSKHTWFDGIILTYEWSDNREDNHWVFKRYFKDYLDHDLIPRIKDYFGVKLYDDFFYSLKEDVLLKIKYPTEQDSKIICKLIYCTNKYGLYDKCKIGDVFLVEDTPIYCCVNCAIPIDSFNNKEKVFKYLENAKLTLIDTVNKVKERDKQCRQPPLKSIEMKIKYYYIDKDEYGSDLPFSVKLCIAQ